MKLENAKIIKPGTFVTPINILLQREKSIINDRDSKDYEKSENSMEENFLITEDDDTGKYIRLRNEMDRRKMEVILRNNSKQDMNLRKNFIHALDRMQKSNQIEQAYFYLFS